MKSQIRKADASMKHLGILLLLLCSAPVTGWERDCSSGSCRVFQYVDIELGSSSEPARILLEVTSSDAVILTALNTRTYHERFYTTKPPTYLEFGRKDYVPIRIFFHEDGPAGRIIVDGNQVAALPIHNESQLKARSTDEGSIVKSFISGTSARVEFSSFVYGKQRATFSLLGFTRIYNSLDLADSPNSFSATQTVDPVSVLTPLLKSNRFSVGPQDLRTKRNPHGSGIFVYAQRTRYSGTERLFVWFVNGGSAVKLNGATHNLTPSLPFPRDARLDFWDGTGLSAGTATATGLKVAFGR